jgi:acetyl esterase/lipase
MHHPDVAKTKNIPYGPYGRRNQLDILYRRDCPENAPVLLHVHGGAWVIGDKEQQGFPLMLHLAARGWVCVTANYRLSPRATWPDHLVDAKRALAWVKDHIAEYGGNPDFVAVTGGSAGGHLCSMLALTPNEPRYQPEFEDADTSVRACVSYYGVYDFTDATPMRSIKKFHRLLLEPLVMKKRYEQNGNEYRAASPLFCVGPGAPPFFVFHGRSDTLVPVVQARHFVEKLRSVSRSPVVYAELPGAQHAFEVFPSIRTAHVVNGAERFLDHVFTSYVAEAGAEQSRPA